MGIFDRFTIYRTSRKYVDEVYYFSSYTDVAQSGMPAAEHYALHGWREGRNPSARFHSAYYAVRYLPNGELCENPLLHFIAHGGERSGRATSPEVGSDWIALQQKTVTPYFDEVYYRKHYGHKLGGLAPIDHYFAIGWQSECNPSGNFDSQSYLDHHPHVVQSDINPLFHYVLLTGAPNEQRTPRNQGSPQHQSPGDYHTSSERLDYNADRSEILRAISDYFDPSYYESVYKDVARANLNPLVHFVDYGWQEGRNPSGTFHTRYYQARYHISHEVNPLYHYAVHGQKNGYLTNPVGRQSWPRPAAPDESDWTRAVAATDVDADVNIIIPVYRGYDDTLATIYSVLTQPQKTRFHLTVINDFSPDPRLTQKLRELAGMSLFTYWENERNLGFIGTINKGLEFLPNCDVILLNADTLVFGDWIDRMLAHAGADTRIGTITPYSNNATICSYPDVNRKNSIALECTLEQIDAYARYCNKGRATAVPTGVGFCFYIRRVILSEIGVLDVAFGRGYGEENDLCMRMIKAGYKNVLAEDIFVFHSGQVSFFEFSDEEYGPGQKLLLNKHPDYARRVAAFVHSDPGRVSRARLDLYRLARTLGDKVALFVSTNGGGGIVTHVNALARRLETSGMVVLLAYVDTDVVTFQPFDSAHDIYAPSLMPIDLTFNRALFIEFLDWLRPTFIHLHSLALASSRAAEVVMTELAAHGARLYVTLHDYDPLCFRHNMVDAEGRFCGQLDARQCGTCGHSIAAPRQCDPGHRIAVWHAFLKSARRIFVPSEDTRSRMSEAFPDLEFLVRDHEEPELDGAPTLAAPETDKPLRLVAIGAIGPHKGSDLIYSLAVDAQTRKLPIEYYVAGYTAIDSEMKGVGVTISGRYHSTEECLDHISAIRPSFAFLPSIWPETYCYTLSIAMALRLPAIVFDLGAQADRVRAARFGVTIDPKLGQDPRALNDRLLELSVADEWAKVRPVYFRHYDRFPTDYYDIIADNVAGVSDVAETGTSTNLAVEPIS